MVAWAPAILRSKSGLSASEPSVEPTKYTGLKSMPHTPVWLYRESTWMPIFNGFDCFSFGSLGLLSLKSIEWVTWWSWHDASTYIALRVSDNCLTTVMVSFDNSNWSVPISNSREFPEPIKRLVLYILNDKWLSHHWYWPTAVHPTEWCTLIWKERRSGIRYGSNLWMKELTWRIDRGEMVVIPSIWSLLQTKSKCLLS